MLSPREPAEALQKVISTNGTHSLYMPIPFTPKHQLSESHRLCGYSCPVKEWCGSLLASSSTLQDFYFPGSHRPLTRDPSGFLELRMIMSYSQLPQMLQIIIGSGYNIYTYTFTNRYYHVYT